MRPLDDSEEETKDLIDEILIFLEFEKNLSDSKANLKT
jgi:hypothetical protein